MWLCAEFTHELMQSIQTLSALRFRSCQQILDRLQLRINFWIDTTLCSDLDALRSGARAGRQIVVHPAGHGAD